MIPEFVQRFYAGRHDLRQYFSYYPPESWENIVEAVVTEIRGDNDPDDAIEGLPTPTHVFEVKDGEWEGTLVFVIGDGLMYSRGNHWYVRIAYGSCSATDTFERIKEDLEDDGDRPEPTAEQIDGYMTLALHVVQNMRQMDPAAVIPSVVEL